MLVDAPYAIALTSIPPRFSRLGPVLESLLAQDPAPETVYLCLPRHYARFPGPVVLPVLPAGVEVLRDAQDHGPACKALIAARHLRGGPGRLIYCDDDWILGPGWAAALLAAQRGQEAVTGQGFGVERLGRVSSARPGYCDIAQGYSGVLIVPDWLADAVPPDDAAARAMDDIWLSAHLAARGIGIRVAPTARQAMLPAYDDAHGLQDAVIAGAGRGEANRRCAAMMQDRHGIWPESG